VTPEVQFPVTVDATEFGESTFDNALPATKIAVRPHASLGNFAPIVPRLMQLHDARVAKDKEYGWWAQDVALFRAERAKKSISLNEADRRAERDRQEARRKQREAERKALGLADDTSNDDDGLQADERDVTRQVEQENAAKNRPDPLLREERRHPRRRDLRAHRQPRADHAGAAAHARADALVGVTARHSPAR
jgi:carboxyl-terminal processing protease